MTTPPADPVQEAERLRVLREWLEIAKLVPQMTEKRCEQLVAALRYAESQATLLASRQEEIERVKAGLIESVKLQSHYAELLNMHDGGQRIAFKDADEWIERLKEVKR
jgi:hypothetical protein